MLAALLGAASFVLLTLGYSAAAHLRGLFYDPTPFVVVGVAVVPFVGSLRAGCGEHRGGRQRERHYSQGSGSERPPTD